MLFCETVGRVEAFGGETSPVTGRSTFLSENWLSDTVLVPKNAGKLFWFCSNEEQKPKFRSLKSSWDMNVILQMLLIATLPARPSVLISYPILQMEELRYRKVK